MGALLLSFILIPDVSRSFIRHKSTVTKYCLTQWISKLPGSFEIHWVRQYLVNYTGLAGIVNATVYKTEPIFQKQEVISFSLDHCQSITSKRPPVLNNKRNKVQIIRSFNEWNGIEFVLKKINTRPSGHISCLRCSTSSVNMSQGHSNESQQGLLQGRLLSPMFPGPMAIFPSPLISGPPQTNMRRHDGVPVG